MDKFRRALVEVDGSGPGRFVVAGPSFVSLIVRFRRRSMRNVARRSARRRKTQAPTIPPNSFALNPEEGVDVVVEADGEIVSADNFAMGVGRAVVGSEVGVGGL